MHIDLHNNISIDNDISIGGIELRQMSGGEFDN